ncbi:origin recognition complex subunit 5 C-terminus-domain-containing protein [Mycena amicta]|nr:origin recognition complex subunit 5 C-terminus-domain-containing protein [Mycena amicta]
MAAEHPGYEHVVEELSTLLTGFAPPFIFVHDPISPRTTASVVSSVVKLKTQASDASTRVDFAGVDAAACFNPRLLYDAVLNKLAQWQPRWEHGCLVWGGDDGERWNQNLDGFLHGLAAVETHIRQHSDGNKEGGQIVILVERAERLQDNMPELIVPLTRLAELTRLNLSVLFVSDVPWEEVRPPFGGSPDPYFIDVGPLDKKAHVARLNRVFAEISAKADHPTQYHPSLRALYGTFSEAVVDVCSVYVQDPVELQYIAAARWPGFVQPVLDDADMDGTALEPPSDHVRMRLIRLWAASHAPEPNLLSRPPAATQPQSGPDSESMDMSDLPRMAKFILIAAYIASTNPQSSDLRMFGRGVAKLPQRVLGPNSFALDRLLAILGALLEENDVDRRPAAPEFGIPGEYTDFEIARIIELADASLLQRASATEKLDGAMFKCGVSYKTVESLSRELDVSLNDLLWDAA